MDDADRVARAHEVDRAERARGILESPLFIDAFADVEKELMTQWKQNTALNQDGRERVFLMVTLLGQVKQSLMQHIQTGEMARIQLKEHKTMRERLGLRSIGGLPK
jgi:hypothetical protein